MTTRSFRLISTVLLTASAAFAGVTHTVDDSGGADFTSIQAAINAASAGDVVYVYPGTYVETITMKDEVNLYSFAPQSTTIDGGTTAVHVVTYSGTVGAVISGFRITGSQKPTGGGTWHYGGIYVDQGPLTIRNNIIEDNHAGISVQPDGNPTIINNTIVDNSAGVVLWDRGGGTPEPPPLPLVAFIYLDDIDAAEEFAQLLHASDIAVDLIHVSAVVRTNLRAYDAILIGSDTGDMGEWADPRAFAVVAESAKPLLGIGIGGSSSFQGLQLDTGWIHGWYNLQAQSLIPVDPAHEIFKSPLPIAIPPQGAPLTVYAKPNTAVEIYLPQMPPDVDPLGRATSEPRHYPLTLEEGRYLLWGFSGPPEIMTQTGKDLFINAVHVLLRRCYPDLPNPEIIATGSNPGGAGYRYYEFTVANWAAYPAELFEPAPYLPPCGLNPNASRTWVDIYAEDGTRLFGFCALDEPIDLRDRLYVSVPADEDPPNIYITLTDRRCDITYVSNVIPLRRDRLVTHTIMNNIITGNLTGIFYYNYTPDGQILYNDVWGNPSGNYHNNVLGSSTFTPQPGTGEISADPLFDDGDYHLGEGSPCIDAGHPALIYNDPDDTRNDMGVYGGPNATGRTGFAGSGFIITSIGTIPTSEITQDAMSASHGLANVDGTLAAEYGIPAYKDTAFGHKIWIHGLFGEADTAVTHYQILVAPWTGGVEPEEADFVPLNGPLTKVKYTINPDFTVTAQHISLGPKSLPASGGGTVDNLYELTRLPYWSHIDLRTIWDTRAWPNGKYTIACRAFNYNLLFGVTPVPVDGNELDHVTVVIDNSPLTVVIDEVTRDDDTPVPDCGIINLSNDTENLKFRITAWHPNGFLRLYSLSALYGKNQNGGKVVQDQFVGVHDATPNWPGVWQTQFNSADAPPGQLQPWQTCAYQFRLQAWARRTNGFGWLGYGEFNQHYYLDVGSCAWCAGADLNHSGMVDLADLAIMAAHWLQPCGPECP